MTLIRSLTMFTKVKTPQEIERMRVSGKMLADVLSFVRSQITPGMTTKDIDILASAQLKRLGGKPAFLGYLGFPASICVSINEEIVHGIPSKRIVQDGDLVSLDFGVNYEGMITDSAVTLVVGNNENPDVSRLLEGTSKALDAAVDVIKHGVRVGDIAAAVQKILLQHQLGIVRELVGHGVGHRVHEEPNIPNYGTAGTGPVLKSGMTIAVEPMAMLGDELVALYDDGWTVATADQSLSAHFEHTILITDITAEVLT